MSVFSDFIISLSDDYSSQVRIELQTVTIKTIIQSIFH